MLIECLSGQGSLLGVEPRLLVPRIALTWHSHRDWYNSLEDAERIRGLSIRRRSISLVGLVSNNRNDHATFPIATVQLGCLGLPILDKSSPASHDDIRIRPVFRTERKAAARLTRHSQTGLHSQHKPSPRLPGQYSYPPVLHIA